MGRDTFNTDFPYIKLDPIFLIRNLKTSFYNYYKSKISERSNFLFFFSSYYFIILKLYIKINYFSHFLHSFNNNFIKIQIYLEILITKSD